MMRDDVMIFGFPASVKELQRLTAHGWGESGMRAVATGDLGFVGFNAQKVESPSLGRKTMDAFALRHLNEWLQLLDLDEQDRLRPLMIAVVEEDPEYWLCQPWSRVRDEAERTE